jgi:hypothetical protein
MLLRELTKIVIGDKVWTRQTGSCKKLSLNMHPGSVETSALAEGSLSACGKQVKNIPVVFRLSDAWLA